MDVAATIDDLIDKGFTRRMAAEYLAILDRERRSGLFDADQLAWAHAHGFFAESVLAYGLTEERLADYLSDYDYARLWPLNGWQRIWINDKLTLYILLQGSDLGRYVPEYYYYSEADRLVPLAGSGFAEGMEGFFATLRDKGTFAAKPSNGALASGFHTLSCDLEGLSIDGERVSAAGIAQFVDTHPNYVFTEFLRPEASLGAINPLIHTLRALVLNPTGTDPIPTVGYLRFGKGMPGSGTGANYVEPTTAEISSYNVDVDLATGRYGGGKLVYANHVEDAPTHPMSGAVVKGQLPQWDEAIEMMRQVALKVGACPYLGFDVCLTDNGPKVMEINSHTGIKYIQVFNPLMTNEHTAEFFRTQLERLDNLDEAARAERVATMR